MTTNEQPAPAQFPLAITLMVSELYRSIQGESTHAGRPCTFVRLSGCPLRCSWCDSSFAFQGGERLTIAAILERTAALQCRLVEVTGGEPLAQPNCLPLFTALCDAGYEVLLETSGSFDIAAVDPRVRRIMDIKCPGSGESPRNRWENLVLLRPGDELKFVIASRQDYDWACGIIEHHALGGKCPVLFSPVHSAVSPAELAQWIIEDNQDVRLQVQLHKVIWPEKTRGV